MIEFLRSKKWTVFFFFIVLLLLAASIYIFLNLPLHEEVESKETVIKSSETYLENLQNDGGNDDKEDEAYLVSLTEKIPHNTNVDDYILSLQSIFEKNKSKINDVEFLYDGTVSDWQQNNNFLETKNEDSASRTINEYEIGTEEELDEDELTSVEQTNDSPEGLEMLIVKISTVSSNYSTFVSLIENLENQQRLSVVKSLDYQTNDKQISSQIELLTFYYPSN